MTVEEAAKFFENTPRVARKLQTLLDVGLGYIKLGQSSTTLSGGESQRIKITRELSKHKSGHVVYMLTNQPPVCTSTTKRLIRVLNRLVDNGNTVYIIEHNLDVIKSCDQLVDLGQKAAPRVVESLRRHP